MTIARNAANQTYSQVQQNQHTHSLICFTLIRSQYKRTHTHMLTNFSTLALIGRSLAFILFLCVYGSCEFI